MTTRKDIENALMRGADTLRDTIDAANYKDYVLPVMFLKYLSDSYADAVEALSLSLIHIFYPPGQIGWRPESIPTLNKEYYTQKSKRRN